MAYYVVRALGTVKAGSKGYYDMLCAPLREDAPAGRRLRMEKEDAVKAVLAGKVEMLSPDGVRDVAFARALEDAPPAPKRRAAYKTRVEQPET